MSTPHQSSSTPPPVPQPLLRPNLMSCRRTQLSVLNERNNEFESMVCYAFSDGTVYLPYRTCESTIYGRTKFCVRLQPCASSARRYRLASPVERVCAKLSHLDSIRRRLALGGVRSENPLQEIAILQELQRGGRRHRNVCTLIQAGQDEEWLYTVWEFCDGGDLQKICSKRTDPVPEAEAKRIFKDALRGLAYMHHHGYAHLDISMENVMMRGGEAVLIDFGMTQRIRVPDVNVGCYGKRMYMHPTMFRHLAEAKDHRHMTGTWSAIECDLWSLSVVLFVMVVGGPPWEWPNGRKDARFRMIVVSGRLEELLERWKVDMLSEHCVRFLQRCFHPDVDRRYRTIAVMLQDPWLRDDRGNGVDDDHGVDDDDDAKEDDHMDTD